MRRIVFLHGNNGDDCDHDDPSSSLLMLAKSGTDHHYFESSGKDVHGEQDALNVITLCITITMIIVSITIIEKITSNNA